MEESYNRASSVEWEHQSRGEGVPRKKACRFCGARIQMDATYCPSCGKLLSYVRVEPEPEPQPRPQSQPQPRQEGARQPAGANTGKGKQSILLLVVMLVFLLGVIVVGGGWFAYQKFYASKFAAGEELEEQMMGHQSLTLYGAVDKYPVTMQINIDKSKVSGTYYYNKKGPDLVLTLRGSLNAEGFMYLDEYDEKGTRTGSFSGYLSNGEYEGEFVTNKGKRMHFLVK